MRKEKKIEKSVELSRVQGYHEGAYSGVNYAFNGFRSRKYFSSDRTIELNERYERADGKPLKGYGLEIETECFTISDNGVLAEVLEKIIFDHFPADLFKLQRDGSLGGNSSAECITQPMTKERVRNLYPAFKLMYNTYFKALGISCSRTGSCGMHVNVSNGCLGRSIERQMDNAKKLLYVINHHYEMCVHLFARNPARTHYCSKMEQYDSIHACQNADLMDMPSSHGNCCNWSHFKEGRIEIRLVGGQKDYGCFRNTMESVFHLISRIQELKWSDLDNKVKLFSGCNQYVYDRLATKVRDAGQITLNELREIEATVVREELL